MKLRLHRDLIAAMRADHIEPQSRGLWYIQRQDFDAISKRDPMLAQWYDGELRRRGAFHEYPEFPHRLTSLNRWTDATLHLGQGESVMSDDPKELRRHLPIVLAARGRVLITGLGLGCVVRGLLARPLVEHIDVVEIDSDVLAMVGPSFADERLALHHDDALAIRWPTGTTWDYAWHDVWGEKPSTQVLHAQLLLRYRRMARRQGAWEFPRWMKRRWSDPLLGASSERRFA